MKKVIITIFFCQLLQYGLSQKVDVLALKHKRFFKEADSFKIINDTLYILCEVCYNMPHVIDEEYCHSISFTVKDAKRFYSGAILDIQKDTTVISTTYDRLSVWNWGGKAGPMRGRVRVLSITGNTIKLDIDIVVAAQEEYTYKGRRKFKRAKVKS